MADNFRNKRRGGGQFRKSEWELQLFLPDSIKSAPSIRNDFQNTYNNKKTKKYGQPKDESIHEHKRRNPYRDGTHAEQLPKSNLQGYNSQGSDTGRSNYTFAAPTKIKNETFETVDASPSRKFILNRNDFKGREEKKDDKLTILKANSVVESISVPVTPVILSRNKTVNTAATKTSQAIQNSVAIAGSNQVVPTMIAPYKIAPKPTAISYSAMKLNPEKEMKRPFRLIDDDFYLCEGYTAFNAYLLDQSNYLVVGVLGLQGVGKSTVANILVSHTDKNSTKDRCFSIAGSSQVSTGAHTTTGLDIYVTSNRTIVMDFPALLSPGVMDSTNTKEASHQGSSLDTQVYRKSLEFLSLAIKTCHVIVLVQDTINSAADLLASLQVAQTLIITGNSDDTTSEMIATSANTKTDPTLILLQNKLKQKHTPNDLHAIEDYMAMYLGGCELSYSSGLNEDSSINLLTLPHLCSTGGIFDGAALRRAVSGVTRRSFGHSGLSEKSWFEYVVREWEKLRKSKLYLDYSRLFP